MSVFEKFKAYFAGTAGKDEAKAEESFNDFFAKEVSTAVGSAYDAKAAELETRLKALEQKETPQAFDATALTQKIEGLEKALNTTKSESEAKVSALVTELQDIKAGTANKPKANNKIPALNVEQNEGGFAPPKLQGF